MGSKGKLVLAPSKGGSGPQRWQNPAKGTPSGSAGVPVRPPVPSPNTLPPKTKDSSASRLGDNVVYRTETGVGKRSVNRKPAANPPKAMKPWELDLVGKMRKVMQEGTRRSWVDATGRGQCSATLGDVEVSYGGDGGWTLYEGGEEVGGYACTSDGWSYDLYRKDN